MQALPWIADLSRGRCAQCWLLSALPVWFDPAQQPERLALPRGSTVR